MRFPNKLTVTALNAKDQTPIENVAILLTLFAVQKNNYSVGPLITDHRGQVEFLRSKCESTITASRKMFLMDYSDSLEDCKPVVEVSLHPFDRIKTMVQQYKVAPEFWGAAFDDPQKYFSALSTVKNTWFEPANVLVTEIELQANPSISLYLTSRK